MPTGLPVAEQARAAGQGIATILPKRTWQVCQQLGYFPLYVPAPSTTRPGGGSRCLLDRPGRPRTG